MHYDDSGIKVAQYLTRGWLSTNWKDCAIEIEKLNNQTVAELGYDELCTGMGETPLAR